MNKDCKQCSKILLKKQLSFCSVDCHSIFRQGKPSCSPETTFKIGQKVFVPIENRKRGQENNKWHGGVVSLECKICSMEFTVDPYRKLSARICSKTCYNEYRKKPEFRLKLSEVHKKLFTEKFGEIRSRLTSLDKIIRHSIQYVFWRESIFSRDGFRCQECGNGGVLRADHIKQFGVILIENSIQNLDDALNCEELWNINNGRTLCDFCHVATSTYGRKVLKINAITL